MPSPLEIVRLTPAGRGAVAVMLLAGQDAVKVLLRHWRGKPPVKHKPVFGRLQLADNLCEEAVVHLTEDGGVELHIHGGGQVVAAVESLFAQYGAVPVSWQNKFAPNPSQRDIALQMLPFAPTERTLQILLDQYHGAEHKHDDVQRREALTFLGKHLIDPFRVVFAGASNAGKSSLINAILGFRRCIVHPIEGTTRDTVCAHTAIDGFPIALYDTAGFRETGDELELCGIERSRQSLSEADLIVWVIDPTAKKNSLPSSFVPQTAPVLLCCNKIDLVTNIADEINVPLKVSALTGQGIDALLQAMIRRLVPYPPEPGETVPLTILPSSFAQRAGT